MPRRHRSLRLQDWSFEHNPTDNNRFGLRIELKAKRAIVGLLTTQPAGSALGQAT